MNKRQLISMLRNVPDDEPVFVETGDGVFELWGMHCFGVEWALTLGNRKADSLAKSGEESKSDG